MIRVLHGDCLDLLRGMDDNSVDAIVTDPPYGLEFMGKDWDAPWKGLNGEVDADAWNQGTSNPYSRGARIRHGRSASYGLGTGSETGQAFQAWCEQWTIEALRVLKPGGHMLAFGGTRTWHRLACAVEDAGFEIRDNIASLVWAYGSGFPKSLSPYRKMMPCPSTDDAPHVVRLSEWHPLDLHEVKGPIALALAETLPEGDLAVLIRTGEAGDSYAVTVTSWSDWTGGTSLNTVSSCRGYSVESWRPMNMSTTSTMIAATTDPRTSNSCRSLLMATSTLPPASNQHGCECDATTVATRSIDGDWKWRPTPTLTARDLVTMPLAPLRGLGTATKPAHEPIVVARKPLAGTVAANVAAWGTGAINIDATRVGTGDGVVTFERHAGQRDRSAYRTGTVGASSPATQGRWPSNLVLSHAPTCGRHLRTLGDTHCRACNTELPTDAPCEARCVDGCPVRDLDQQSGTRRSAGNYPSDATGDGIFGRRTQGDLYADAGGASRFFPVFRYQPKAPSRERPKVNGVAHSTVKPLALMRWMVRLVTPPGGTVLDMFAGSGTTGEAAALEGFDCILIEREATYLPLIAARLERVGADYDCPTIADTPQDDEEQTA